MKKRVDSDSDSNPDSRFQVLITPLLVLQLPGAFHDQLDSNPDSDSSCLDSDSDPDSRK